MRQHHLILFIFFLSSIVLGAFLPSLQPHNRLQLAGEAALQDRGPDLLEVRGKKKKKKETPSTFQPGKFFVTDGSYSFYSPSSIGGIILDTSKPLDTSEPGCYTVAMITTTEPTAGELTFVSEFLSGLAKEAMREAMKGGPYYFVPQFLAPEHARESTDPRLRWAFKFGPTNFNILRRRLWPTSQDSQSSVTAFITKKKTSPPFFAYRFKGCAATDQNWVFIFNEVKGKYVVAVLTLPDDPGLPRFISAEEYLPSTTNPPTIINPNALELLKRIRERSVVYPKEVSIDEIEVATAGSENDFVITYSLGKKMEAALFPDQEED